MAKTKLGNTAHFVSADGTHHAAVIVNDWPNNKDYQHTGTVNLMVILDGTNDRHHFSDHDFKRDGYLRWETSVPYSAIPAPNTWHWIE